jgi:hypothetical protein
MHRPAKPLLIGIGAWTVFWLIVWLLMTAKVITWGSESPLAALIARTGALFAWWAGAFALRGISRRQ